jgi:hypothetical protein
MAKQDGVWDKITGENINVRHSMTHTKNTVEIEAPANKVSLLMPTQIKVDDLALLEPDEHDVVHVLSEQMTCDWIGAYLAEMQQVETFFSNKLEDLIS